MHLPCEQHGALTEQSEPVLHSTHVSCALQYGALAGQPGVEPHGFWSAAGTGADAVCPCWSLYVSLVADWLLGISNTTLHVNEPPCATAPLGEHSGVTDPLAGDALKTSDLSVATVKSAKFIETGDELPMFRSVTLISTNWLPDAGLAPPMLGSVVALATDIETPPIVVPPEPPLPPDAVPLPVPPLPAVLLHALAPNAATERTMTGPSQIRMARW